jgi:hypothetical protein
VTHNVRELLDEVIELAAQQHTSVDQIVSLALTAQVSAWRTRESIASRAGRVDWQKVDEILTRARYAAAARRRTVSYDHHETRSD